MWVRLANNGEIDIEVCFPDSISENHQIPHNVSSGISVRSDPSFHCSLTQLFKYDRPYARNCMAEFCQLSTSS